MLHVCTSNMPGTSHSAHLPRSQLRLGDLQLPQVVAAVSTAAAGGSTQQGRSSLISVNLSLPQPLPPRPKPPDNAGRSIGNGLRLQDVLPQEGRR